MESNSLGECSRLHRVSGYGRNDEPGRVPGRSRQHDHWWIGGLSRVRVASSGGRQCHHIWCRYVEPREGSLSQAARGPRWSVRTTFRRRNNGCRCCARGDRFQRGPICLPFSYGSCALQCQILCQSGRHRVPGWTQRIGEIHYSQLGRWFLSARSWARCD